MWGFVQFITICCKANPNVHLVMYITDTVKRCRQVKKVFGWDTARIPGAASLCIQPERLEAPASLQPLNRTSGLKNSWMDGWMDVYNANVFFVLNLHSFQVYDFCTIISHILALLWHLNHTKNAVVHHSNIYLAWKYSESPNLNLPACSTATLPTPLTVLDQI